jgi:hypothetical protein
MQLIVKSKETFPPDGFEDRYFTGKQHNNYESLWNKILR